MEKCSPAEDFIGYKTLANCEIRLKYCLKVLHLLKIIHKDIKPSNIMYSKSIKDFVLCDFGLSQSVG
jgi:serine/threonine protein kinase